MSCIPLPAAGIPWRTALIVAALALVTLPVPSAAAQTPGQEAPQAAATDPDDEALSRKERKRLAKERRIEEYLRKKEEKRQRKEQGRAERELQQREEAARALEAEQLASAPPTPAPARRRPVVTSQPVEPLPRAVRKARALPRNLARAQDNVRSTELALDPTVQEYLVLIDQQKASAHQLAAFANFLAQNGLVRDALQYYEVALSLVRDDPVLWINAGTLHQQLRDLGSAEAAYVRALGLNPNSALAHYNLGTVLNEMNRYDDALAAYRAALFLDPTLGDPTVNPQAANNNLLTAVKLMLYQEQVGSLSLPLIDIPAADQYGDRSATE